MKNYKNFSLVFIRLLRGKETQISFSEKMGYGFNISSRWENGKKRILWEDILKLSQYFNWDISSVLESVTHSTYSKNPDAIEVTNNIFKNDMAFKQVEKKFTTQKIHRLRAGSIRLQFIDFLIILNCVYGREERFLNLLLGSDKVKEIYEGVGEHYEERSSYRDLVAKDPIYSVIVNCLKLGSYKRLEKHSDIFLADKIGIPEEEISFRVKYLLNVGIIEKNNEIFKQVFDDQHNDLGAHNKESSKSVSDYWRARASKSSANQNTPEAPLKHAFLIYQSNESLNEKVFEMTKNFYRDIQNLVNDEDLSSTTDSLSYIAIDLLNTN